jgi:orotidine-5'-phosphate decarboxylase
VIDRLPAELRDRAVYRHGDGPLAVAMAFLEFGRGIIDATAEYAACVKPQSAFFEACGPVGLFALQALIEHANERGLLVIEDAKRNDIGSTAEAYAQGHLGKVRLIGGGTAHGFTADALTVNPYLGRDGLTPFIQACVENGKGIFALARTSNPSAGDVQDLLVDGTPVYLKVAALLAELGKDLLGEHGYSPVGAVVGATWPRQAVELRQAMPHNWFLVPGYGAQGATAADVVGNFDPSGFGAVVSSSRAVIFAHATDWAKAGGLDYRAAAAEAARKMRDEINQVLAAR